MLSERISPVWVIRPAFIAIVGLIANLLTNCFSLAARGLPLWPPIRWGLMDSAQWLTFVALWIGLTGTVLALFNWFAEPALLIKVHESPDAQRTSPPATHGRHSLFLGQAGEPLLVGYNHQTAIRHLEIWNCDHNIWWRTLVKRPVLEGCQVKFQYVRHGSASGEFGGEWLLGRWDDNPEPVSLGWEIEGEAYKPVAVLDIPALIANRRLPRMFPSEDKRHIDAGPAYTVPVAIKREGAEDCYHFNDESYRYLQRDNHWLCNPEYKLSKGTYTVNVRVTGYGLLKAARASFTLTNEDTSLSHFVLQPPS